MSSEFNYYPTSPLTVLLQHIRALVQNARPDLNVAISVYPQYETRGELGNAVARFREWLQNTVIDIEVAAKTPHPTIDPSVHTILVGHSMGGIVAADTLLSIMDDDVVATGASKESKLPFPHIVGILAFDTPYLGLAPSVFAHSAQEKWKSASAAYGTLSSIASGLFATQAAVEGTKASAQQERERRDKEKNELADQSLWGKWGKMAAYGGAAAALAGGAAAAYIKRDDLGAGFGWVQSHLEFVGVLMKAQELQNRVNRASTTDGVGFANLFTSLGGDRMGTSMLFQGKERTFCSLPEENSPLRKKFYRCVNSKADDEVGAHCSMFEAKTNPAYYELADRARNLICVWVPEDAFPLIVEEDFSLRKALARASTFEKESKSSKSSRRSSRDHDDSRQSSRDHRKSSSRDLERTDSGRSSRSGHDKDKKERKEKKDKEEKKGKREKKERPGSVYSEYEEVGPGLLRRATMGLFSKDKHSEREEEPKKLARRSTAPQY
jgi:hypothetical protein